MLREHGFSYTKSELEDKESSTSGSGSSSDEFYSDDFQDSIIRARRAKKDLGNRLRFLKNHMQLLNFEEGKVLDPFKHKIIQKVEENDSKIRTSSVSSSQWLPASEQWTNRGSISTFATVGTQKSIKPGAESRGDLPQDRQTKSKTAAEEIEKKLGKYHALKMKKQVAIEKLQEFLEVLQEKQQSKLVEEHNTNFRQFKYSGPAREGALFCLREQFRRERKSWRVKYAKKYGLLCREFRLEKRLMRKARRLITKDRILNALKDKSRSKVLVLMEMRHEFKKLVEKLKLNKEIQEKIRRQEKLYKANAAKLGRRAVKLMSKMKTASAKLAKSPRAPGITTSAVQKESAMVGNARDVYASMTSLGSSYEKLPPLPRVPKSMSAIKTVSRNAGDFKFGHLKRLSGARKLGLDVLRNRSKLQKAKVDDMKTGTTPSSTSFMDHGLPSITVGSVVTPKSTGDPSFVRVSEMDRLPVEKYKSKEHIQFFDSVSRSFKRLVGDELAKTFRNRSNEFIDNLAQDLKKITDFVFDNLDMISSEDLETVLKNLAKLRDEPDIERMYDTNFESTIIDPHQDEYLLRKIVDRKKKSLVETLNAEFSKYKRMQKRRRDDRRTTKSGKKPPHVKDDLGDEVKAPAKIIKRRPLADKLLLRRNQQFRNPVKVTTKLGGKFILKGWRHLTYEQYVYLGSKLPIQKSGWRKDGMENYEAIAPLERSSDDIKYHLVINRLDLTPRRFKFPGYQFTPNNYRMMKYCSDFYRMHMLKRDERKKERAKRASPTRTSRDYVTTELLPGEVRVPHLMHRIIQATDDSTSVPWPTDKHTPPMFCKRSDELEEFEEHDVKELRIRLQETATIDLWSFPSVVAMKGSDEADALRKDAKSMRQSKARYRRTFSRETQTELVFLIQRGTQLSAPGRDSRKTNVYEFDLLKSHEIPAQKEKKFKTPGFQEDDESDSSSSDSASSAESLDEGFNEILTSGEFMSQMNMAARIAGSMAHSESQLIFHRGLLLDPLSPEAHVDYSHEKLFSFVDKRIALSELAVTCMHWSPYNPNLLCVGYTRHPLYPEQDQGRVCIWNLKLPAKYERQFKFTSGVTFAQFCEPYPRLLNVALHDGSVMILDLTSAKRTVIMTKFNSVFSNFLPVWQFSWFELEKGYHVPLACGDNGFIHQLRPDGTFQPSVFLSLGHREGAVKGIKLTASMGYKPRIKGRPGITCLQKHPSDPVLYLVGTSDGCVHVCSVHFRNQHLDVFSAHVGAVKGIQFHPNCKDVFLTFGDDFFVRVWLYGKFEPALELMAGDFYVRGAQWSPANPEILVTISDKYVNVWDIRRKTDAPIHAFKNPRDLENTSIVFDWTGKNLAVGNIGGDVYVYALKNMPFSHHFKGEAIYSSLEKVMKPMLERKRRARINRCLDELKELMVTALQSEGENVSKLEKADILELTVRHLQSLRSASISQNSGTFCPNHRGKRFQRHFFEKLRITHLNH
ncbi:unnamed protein product [Nesidiocoris tenuis]|uniref:Dynein axonemal intermediate chain 4 n=1 Tax=Nesidiocoris tenuis TaxID=355587 RepID=A0A6H5G0D5_9HEMI|nr:unnamed protein product [Nesidiocoris tenuis]